jgi:hypothetical protein
VPPYCSCCHAAGLVSSLGGVMTAVVLPSTQCSPASSEHPTAPHVPPSPPAAPAPAAADSDASSAMSMCGDVHPLATAVMLCVEAVARRQRVEESRLPEGHRDAAAPYLCVGCDVYVTAEPCAMSVQSSCVDCPLV